MTPAKQRALVALVEATDRKFLANAPLMAIVEAVQVLDEAGLLAAPATPSAEVTARAAAMSRESAAVEETMRRGIEESLKFDDEANIRRHLLRVVDSAELKDGALALCELVDDAEKAKAVLDDEGFHGRTLEAQVRALVVAWSDERDDARRGRFARSVALESLIQLHDVANTFNDEDLGQNSLGLRYSYLAQSGFDALGVGNYEDARAEHCPDAPADPCPGCGVSANEAHPGNCPTVAPPRTHCPRCNAPLDDGRTCSNFPDCPDALLPF